MSSGLAAAQAGALLGSALDELDFALRSSRRSIAIATPFMSLPVAEQLIRASDEGLARQRRLITAINDVAVTGGYLDPYAVEAFVDAGFDVRSLRNLHAKVVLVDRSWGIIGSGNLTAAGIDGGNAELGVVLGVKQSVTANDQHFASWWRAAEPVDMDRLRALARRRRPASPQRKQRAGQGGIWKPERTKPPRLPKRRESGGYWLKIMYDLPGRHPASHWRGGTWVSDRHTFAADGRTLRRPTYEIGDHLVVYLTQGERAACPAILKVTAEPVFDPDRVRREGRPGDDERWAWLTEVEGVRAVEIADAPTLSDIGVSSDSVRQQGHIHLTPQQYRRAYDALRP
jgi:hypothetical protein